MEKIEWLWDGIYYFFRKGREFTWLILYRGLNFANDLFGYIRNKYVTIRFELRGSDSENEDDFLIINIPWRRRYEIKLDDESYPWLHFSLNELKAISAKLNFYLKTHSPNNVPLLRQNIYVSIEDEIEAYHRDLNNARVELSKKRKGGIVVPINSSKRKQRK